MRNQRRIILCVLFAVLCLTPMVVHGQEQDEEDQSGKAEVALRGLLVINGSNSTKVTFSVRNGDSDWVNFSLNPRKQVTLENTTNIRIATEDAKLWNTGWNIRTGTKFIGIQLKNVGMSEDWFHDISSDLWARSVILGACLTRQFDR